MRILGVADINNGENVGKMNPMTKHISAVILSVIVSYILSTSADLDKLELGALTNVSFPPVIGVLTICLYLLLGWIFKSRRDYIMIVCVLINLATGIILLVVDM